MRELQVLKEDKLWENRLVSHVSFSFSILSLQHSLEFRFLKSSPCLHKSNSQVSFFYHQIFLHFCPSTIVNFHPVLVFDLYFVLSNSCHALLALSGCCVVPDSFQGIHSVVLLSFSFRHVPFPEHVVPLSSQPTYNVLLYFLSLKMHQSDLLCPDLQLINSLPTSSTGLVLLLSSAMGSGSIFRRFIWLNLSCRNITFMCCVTAVLRAM